MCVRLTGEVRFFAVPDAERPADAGGIRPYLVLRATVGGPVDPQTGFVCNVREIGRALRTLAIPLVGRIVERSNGSVGGAAMLTALWDELTARWPGEAKPLGLELAVTPFLRFGLQGEVPEMVFVTQSFEFSASHRLHNPRFTDSENRAAFGKCNNPTGHGHNYVVEVTVKGEPDEADQVVHLGQFERVVTEQVIDRFDHKNLNADCQEFGQLNATVENIVRAVWALLEGRFAPAAELHGIRVWETPKTSAEYFGPAGG